MRRREISVAEASLEAVGIERDENGRFVLLGTHVLVMLLVLLPLSLYGAYRAAAWYIIRTADDHRSLKADVMDAVREAQARDGGTLGDYYRKLVARERDAANLREVEGWTCHFASGGEWVVRFSYEDARKTNVAEWSVDPLTRRVRPLNQPALNSTARPPGG